MKFLKKLFAPVDMTLGKPWEDILVFTLPMLLGNIAQQLYNTVDSVVVGRYVGDNALAAVGIAGNAGQYFGLVYLLSSYYVYRNCRNGVLQYFKRYSSWNGRFDFSPIVSFGSKWTKHCAGSFVRGKI